MLELKASYSSLLLLLLLLLLIKVFPFLTIPVFYSYSIFDWIQ